MRVAIYARYSSDSQDVRSIADQIALARERAEREGWTVTGLYEDAAISGAATLNRPGLLRLLADANSHAFDAILTESLDRLSRDLEDIAGIHKRLSYLGIKIVTLADGEVGKLHVGIKGLIASLYLEDLAQKTRRGQIGRVAAGMIPGGRCYGYDVVSGERGKRTINEAEAGIVRRIFTDYLAGLSPLKIARTLNQEGVRGPTGGLWTASALNGSRKRGNGILSNALYVGEIVYNRQRFVKDPATGRRQARLNPPEEWRRQAVPELTIVDRETWDRAQALRAQSSFVAPRKTRPKRLLSGRMMCGCCGGSYIVGTRDYLRCSNNVNKGTCENTRNVRIDEVEQRVIGAVRSHLMSPEAVALAVNAYREERARIAKEKLAKARAAEKDAAEIERRIGALVRAIEEGGETGPLVDRLKALEAQRRLLADAAAPRAADVVALHPNAAKSYQRKIEALHAALGANAANSDAARLFRELVTEVRITPASKGEPVSIDIIGDLAAFMQPPEGAVTKLMVAGVGFEPTTFRL